MSHEKKPSYFPLYWLVNRDSHEGSITPYITQPTRVFFVAHVSKLRLLRKVLAATEFLGQRLGRGTVCCVPRMLGKEEKIQNSVL